MKKIKDVLRKYFFTGLLVIIPAWATYYVLEALMSSIDGILGDLPASFIGHRIPGLGIVTLALIVFFVGLLSANFIGKHLVGYGEQLMRKVPLARGVYSTVKQIMETFSMKQNFQGVALVEYPRKGCFSVGFVTGTVQGEPLSLQGTHLTVFVPTTPNPTAGFLLLLPEDQVMLLDMTVEQGMKFIVSVGLVSLSEVTARKMQRPSEEGAA